MNSKEVIQAFNDETPVRYGNLVFNRIESVNYKRAHYNQYIESETLDGVKTGLKIPKTIKIVQAICSDTSGSFYILNPRRLEPATAEEVNIVTDVDYILNERMKLLPVFNDWCREHSVPVNIESFLIFLYAEDLLNAGKAYHVVEAFNMEAKE